MNLSRNCILILVGACLFFVTPAFSDYVGSDTGCFYDLLDTSCALDSSTTSLGVGKDGPLITFAPTSGFAAPDLGGQIDLGTFAVTSTLAIADGTFDIDVEFTDPAAGGNLYAAQVLGLVVFDELGAKVTFEQPTTQVFDYAGGSFTVSLPDEITIGAGSTNELFGDITPAPEPSLKIALGGVLVLLGLAARRRYAEAE